MNGYSLKDYYNLFINTKKYFMGEPQQTFSCNLNLEDYKKLREKIINKISKKLFNNKFVFACFLGGSDANNEVYNYSDIDLFLCVGDKNIDEIFFQTKNILSELGELDFVSKINCEGNQIGQYFHLKGTPESLLIEIWMIKKSFGVSFELGHPYFKPKVIFDKENIIVYTSTDKTQLNIKIKNFILDQKDLLNQSVRVKNYIQRKNYIESTNYYMKYIFLPLVALLRVKYTPILYNWGRIHISRHFPEDVVFRLEELMKFRELIDLENNVTIAKKWSEELLRDLENKNYF